MSNLQHIFGKIIFFLIISSLVSCSITKRLPENSRILSSNKIICENKNINTDEVLKYINQKPNRKFLGMSVAVWVHQRTKNSQKRVPTWFRKTLGEPEVLFDTASLLTSVNQIATFINSKGYYGSKVFAQVKPRGVRKKKVRVEYTIQTGKVYMISSVLHKIADSAILDLVQKHTSESFLKSQTVFDISLLQQEQKRLSRIINSHGYYNFLPDNISFEADTTKGNQNVSITISIAPNQTTQSGEYAISKIKNVFIYIDNPTASFKVNDAYDTLKVSQYLYYICRDTNYLHHQVVTRSNYITQGSLYSVVNAEKTQTELLSNKLFKSVQISFTNAQIDSLQQVELDCHIRITPYTIQSVKFEIEGLNSGGDWGAQANMTYVHKNIFSGSEQFRSKALVAGEYNNNFEWGGKASFLKTFEYGLELGLDIPKFVSPFKFTDFVNKYHPKTVLLVSANMKKTVDFSRPTVQAAYGYTWNTTPKQTHIFNIFDLSYIQYYDESIRFNIFLNKNEYNKYSYEDNVITSVNYSYFYNNKTNNVLANNFFLHFTAESSGNILYTASSLADKASSQLEPYSLLGVDIAHYIKTELDLRYYHKINPKITNVYRAFSGIGVPLENSLGLPSVKKFYCGGANSLRAWSHRTLGPGSYVDSSGGLKYYMGDVKIEASLETRFKMFWIVEGAVFVDVGNIWTWKNNDLEGAEFFVKQFYKQLAVGAGYGMRFDFSFLLFRLDLGIKMKEPRDIVGSNSSWIIGNRKLVSDDFNLNIGIGYPF